uniref:Uncharacterized protein n=1 Tax=Romanomermis culicivorax TaxID=13658 RepID=A0A915L8E0_ROMCU
SIECSTQVVLPVSVSSKAYKAGNVTRRFEKTIKEACECSTFDLDYMFKRMTNALGCPFYSSSRTNNLILN